MRDRVRHIILAGILPFCVHGQNLVGNPSFEEYRECPERLGNFNSDLPGWTTPTEGSTDYFNDCSTVMGTPDNFNGTQHVKFGQGYAGMYMYAPDDYREYIQTRLAVPLQKGETYRVSFYVSRAESSDYAIREFGVLFLENPISLPITKELSRMQLYKQKDNAFTSMEIAYPNFFKDTREWIPVRTDFVAKGTEEYMIIGNFRNNDRTRTFKTKRGAKKGAYYYIDMVSVAAEGAQPAITKIAGEERPAFELDKTHTVNSVLFAFDSDQLLESAKSGLNRIWEFLRDDPSLFIRVNGHTDTIGTDNYNKVLSEKRCRAVAEYMIGLGLPREQISWVGYGASKPVADNKTEVGRKLNRRVEFVISRKLQDKNKGGN